MGVGKWAGSIGIADIDYIKMELMFGIGKKVWSNQGFEIGLDFNLRKLTGVGSQRQFFPVAQTVTIVVESYLSRRFTGISSGIPSHHFHLDSSIPVFPTDKPAG